MAYLPTKGGSQLTVKDNGLANNVATHQTQEGKAAAESRPDNIRPHTSAANETMQETTN